MDHQTGILGEDNIVLGTDLGFSHEVLANKSIQRIRKIQEYKSDMHLHKLRETSAVFKNMHNTPNTDLSYPPLESVHLRTHHLGSRWKEIYLCCIYIL